MILTIITTIMVKVDQNTVVITYHMKRMNHGHGEDVFSKKAGQQDHQLSPRSTPTNSIEHINNPLKPEL